MSFSIAVERSEVRGGDVFAQMFDGGGAGDAEKVG
jgi:hypothetical protein